jgi:hypothetical protein
VALSETVRYQGRKARSEQTWDKHSEVLADHSTDVGRYQGGREGGEVCPSDPL